MPFSAKGRKYFGSNSPENTFLQLAARYSTNAASIKAGGYVPEDKMISLDVGYGKQFLWNRISFDPYIAVGAGSLQDNYGENVGETRIQAYGLLSLDFGIVVN